MTNPWAGIVGRRAEGRKEAVLAVVDGLRRGGRTVCGFVHERYVVDGQVEGYDLFDLATGERIPMARGSREPEVCDWTFDEAAFAEARDRIARSSAEIGVLELGPLEARGKGHWQGVTEMLEGSRRLVLLTIRPDILARIAIDLADPVAGLELPATDADIAEFVRGLAEHGATRG